VIVCLEFKSRLAKTVPSPHSAFLAAQGIGVHLIGVSLMGVHLTGVHLMGIYLTGCIPH
jgi:hypothetical protein